MNLASHLRGRDNNLNLLRAIAATAVIFSHSSVLVTGIFDAEPLRSLLGMSLGDIAVDVFFVVSGLLVTGSIARKNDLRGYAMARIRRIYPGLLAMLLVVNIPVGLWLTTLPWSDYLRSGELRANFVQNLFLLKQAWTSLPGVMSEAPWPHTINGSLWTLTYEVRLYVWLGAIWALARLFRTRSGAAFQSLVAATWIASYVAFLFAADGRTGDPVPRLVLMFSSGALLYTLKDRVVLGWRACAAFAAILVASWWQGPLFRPVYGLVAPYLVLVAAYLPSGVVRRYNAVGDYSFGLYIYAFPVQQILVQFRPHDPPFANALLSLAVTSAFAWTSWHLVESRFLAGRAREGNQAVRPERPSAIEVPGAAR